MILSTLATRMVTKISLKIAIIAGLSIALTFSLFYNQRLLKTQGKLIERLKITEAHINLQNSQIQSLKIQSEKYRQQRPKITAQIQGKYRHITTHNITQCEAKLKGVQELLDAFRGTQKVLTP